MMKALQHFVLVGVCFGFVSVAQSQQAAEKASARAIAQPKDWYIEVNGSNLKKSGILDRVFGVFGDEGLKAKQLIQRYQSVIGIDPFQDIEFARIEGHLSDVQQLDKPDEILRTAKVAMTLSKPGNLEGLMLAFPNYAFEESKGIHSFDVGDIGRVYCSFKKESRHSNGPVDVLISLSRSDVLPNPENEISSPSDKIQPDTDFRLMRARISENVIYAIHAEIASDADDPIANSILSVVKTIRNASVFAAQDKDGSLTTRATITLKDSSRTDQFSQLIRAGLAFMKIQLADEGAPQVLIHVLEKASVHGQANTVHIESQIHDLDSLLQLIQSL